MEVKRKLDYANEMQSPAPKHVDPYFTAISLLPQKVASTTVGALAHAFLDPLLLL
jgi:hypothetical protein